MELTSTPGNTGGNPLRFAPQDDYAANIERSGFVIVPDVLDRSVTDRLVGELRNLSRSPAIRQRRDKLHASSTARLPRHRRVLHFEFSANDLPGGLEWYGS